MSKNKKSLPHDGKSGHHIDNYIYQEGKEKPQKYHELIDGEKVDPKSKEALRQRIGSKKGY